MILPNHWYFKTFLENCSFVMKANIQFTVQCSICIDHIWIRRKALPEGDWAQKKAGAFWSRFIYDIYYTVYALHFYLFPHRFMNNISTSLFLCVHNCTDFICVLLLPPISCLTEMRQLWGSGQFNADSSQVDSNIHWLGQSSWGAFASSAVLGRYKDLGPFEALLESWSYDILWL